jgi:hypothetical protein
MNYRERKARPEIVALFKNLKEDIEKLSADIAKASEGYTSSARRARATLRQLRIEKTRELEVKLTDQIKEDFNRYKQ